MKNNRVLSVVMSLCTGLYACQTNVDAGKVSKVCTQEFRSVVVKVLGDSLTNFYTIRLSTLDTIRLSTGIESETHSYIVLDDSYQRQLANKQEKFRFIGKKGQIVVVSEDYLIAADQCHIDKVSGKSEIQL